MDRDRVKDTFDRRFALLACGHWVVGHRLQDLEVVAVAAAVLVDRHEGDEYCSGSILVGTMKARRGGLGGVIVVAGLLATAQSAYGFGLSSPNAQPADLQAGANSDLSITIDVDEPEAQLRDLTIHLPPGLVGNPLATPQCTEAQLNSDAGCPAASDVGDVSNDITLQVPVVGPVGQTVTGDVYNVVPRIGEPGRFGIILESLPLNLPPPFSSYALPPIVLQSPAVLRQSDFGLDSVLTNLPRTAQIAPLIAATIEIESLTLDLAGTVGSPPTGFLRNPTSCKQATIGFDGRAWSGETAAGQAPSFTPTNCEDLPFTPELRAVSNGQGHGPIEFSTTISQTIEEAGLADAQVILPTGLTGSNDLLGSRCPRADFEAGSCPASTIVGTASASSPLQSAPLTGTVAVVEPIVPGLPDVGLDLRGPLALKLTGSLSIDAGGRAITTFAGLPDIPIADFELTFTRDPGFVIAGVDMCEVPLIVDGAFEAHSGAETTVQAPIDATGCGQTERRPKAKVKLRKLKSDEPALRLIVKAGSERMRRATLLLPKQLGFSSGGFRAGTKAKANGKLLKGKAIKHTGRTLRLKHKRAKRFVAKVADGALTAGPEVEKRMRFKVKVVDETGKRTRLKLRSR
jgi:hypothetical protein